MSFTWLDTTVVILYILVILYIGLFLTRKNECKEDSTIEFLLAGRRLTLPLFVATLVATWYGNILGVGEFIYSGGIVGWVCFGLPYYFAAALFAIFAAKKIRLMNVNTIPEQITLQFGKKAGWFSSIIVLIITLPAAYILMLGVIIQLFSGWQLWICVILGAILSLTYIFTGGFKADIFTNAAQFILMYIGFAALLVFSVIKLGKPDTMLTKLPESHLKFFGGYSWQIIVSWFIISLQTFVDPSFHQRCSAAKSPNTARNGIIVSILCWIAFDMLTLTAGLYAKAYFNISDPLMAFPIIGNNVLPPLWKGIFVVAMLAVVMSTLDSYSFISAATIGNDILSPLKSKLKFLRRYNLKTLIRFGLILTGFFGVIMALILPSAVQLIYKTSSIAIPGLLVPLLVSFGKKYNMDKSKALIIMISSSSISALWTAGKFFSEKFAYSFLYLFSEIEPMIPGILFSAVFGIIFTKKVK